MVDTLVLGGGITGLTVAYQRKKQGKKVLLLEKGDRLGGWIRAGDGDPYFFERGPKSIRGDLPLIEELGLEVVPSRASQRYLLQKGKLREVPMGPFALLTTPWVWPWLPTLLKGFVRAPSIQEDESIASYFSRRFSPAFVDTWIDPLVTGIWAGDPHHLSIKSCSLFGQKGKGFYTLKGGLSTLIDALSTEVEVKTEVTKISPGKVETTRGIFEAPEIISTLPAYALAPLIGEPELEKIEYRSLTTVHLGYAQNLLPREGFGYLIARQEKEPILGVVWDSSVFPEQNKRELETRLTVMIAGKGEESIALEAIARHLGVTSPPDWVSTEFHERAIPQFPVGYEKLLANIRQKIAHTHPGLILAGSYCSGVSVRDCICYALAV